MAHRLGVKAVFAFGAGWFANTVFNEFVSKPPNKSQSVLVDGRLIKSRPALPIFGVVSAATPYDASNASDVATRVSQVTFSVDRYFNCDNNIAQYLLWLCNTLFRAVSLHTVIL